MRALRCAWRAALPRSGVSLASVNATSKRFAISWLVGTKLLFLLGEFLLGIGAAECNPAASTGPSVWTLASVLKALERGPKLIGCCICLDYGLWIGRFGITGETALRGGEVVSVMSGCVGASKWGHWRVCVADALSGNVAHAQIIVFCIMSMPRANVSSNNGAQYAEMTVNKIATEASALNESSAHAINEPLFSHTRAC